MKQNQQPYIQQRLEALGFKQLNNMQQTALDVYADNDNLILLSPTGSGKTIAFLLPMAMQLNDSLKEIQTLIIVPSRELALQIDGVFKSMKPGFRSLCCYGGHDIKKEIIRLAEKPEVVIGTPGRLLDHLNHGNFSANHIATLILDEFDKALELGFTDEMSALIGQIPHLKKRVLTSATEGTEIPSYTGLNTPKTYSFLSNNSKKARLDLFQVHSPENDKLDTLYRLICEIGEGQTIVFSNYRESSDRISQFLTRQGILNVLFHGGMEQSDREKALARFRNGSVNVLVSTDLAARGLDISDIKHIIHYHLPVNQEAFIHRNGRTARMDKSGTAFLILGPNEYLPEYVDQNIPFQKISDTTPAPVQPQWTTLYIGKGKRDKLSKGDIVGFLIQKGGLNKNDIGMIDLTEYQSYAAVPSGKIKTLLKTIEGHKIKNMKTKFAIAK